MAEEKKKFSLSILSWYRYALENHQIDDFLAAVRVLVEDRFPPLGLEPKTEEYQRTVLAEMDAFEFDLMLSCIHPDHRDIVASTTDWRPVLTLTEDRKQRREEWEARGGGIPHDHQFIVAYEVEEQEMSYWRTFLSCFIA
ncbi:hypothetical protein PLEOSDRAFT_1108591 [Pleurotus ostreatus PC15]|uniref:Uncharacterized protein n=2 Tax=Pleurotus TaxID=5320 RepID=A0A067N8F3_PLEO1|nr:hypothetical protein CCMSSC00406_0009804 [Pleurotus cornucopiae]KDQ24134.1 hypothetical protein PLEOSDRAFT_1108591 [Pleurotus ostreatus PC15]